MSYIADKELETMQRLINFGASDNVSTVENKPVLEYHMKGADGNLYGIIKECNKYYVKVAPPKDTEVLAEDYNYIGGINNKKDYEYPSYALAYKQFELKMMSLNEAYANNKQYIRENVVKEEKADWQTLETKEMRAEIERFNQISENVCKILNEKTDAFTTQHTLPEAPAKNPSDKKVNDPYTDTAVANGDKDFKKELTNHEKAGKPYDKDGKATDSNMTSDKANKGEKGEVYKEKAKFVPDNSVADKKPSGGKVIRVTEGKGKPVFLLSEEQVLAWQKELNYMDKSHGTEIGDTAPYTEKCTCGKSDCPVCGNKDKEKVNEGYYDEPQSPEDVVNKMSNLRSNIIGLENGDYLYLDYDPENNRLIAGGATNSGIVPDYTQEYDFDYSFDQNLQAFIETIESQVGYDGMGESCANKGKKVNEGGVMHNSDNQNIPTPGNGEIGDGQPYDNNVNEENIDVNDVAGMPDEEDEELPFPGVGSYYDDERLNPESTAYDPSDLEFDSIPDGEEWGFEDDNDIYGESKQNKGKRVNENITLTDFGKHPAYQKVVMTTPPNKEVSKIGREWDDVSAQGDKPFGLQIGSNAPYTEDALDYLADAIIKEFFKGKKKKLSESKYFSPKDIMDFYNRQDALSDTERWALDASFWARAMLANYHGYSKEIPAVELKDGKFFVNTSKGRIEVPYNYKDLHSMYNIQERKVLKVDTNEPDMNMMQQDMPQNDNMDMGDEPMPDEQNMNMGDTQEEIPNQFDTNFDAGVEADEETDPKRYIQQLAGKLSQSLRSYNSELPSPDTDLNKYVMGMINKQAIKGMNDKDVNDVLSKIKGDEDEDDMENYNMEDNSNEQPEDDMNQNESIKRNVINELFQELIGNDNDVNKQIKDKPITNIGYRKKPFTSPSFK